MFLPITLINDTMSFYLQTDLLELKRKPMILRPSFDPYPWSTSKNRSDQCLKNSSPKISRKCRSEHMRLSLMTLMILKKNHVMYLVNRHLIRTGSILVGESLPAPSVFIAHASLSFASSTIPCGLSSIPIVVMSHLVPSVVDLPFSAYERRRLLCSGKNVTESLRILFEFDVIPTV